MSEKPKPRRKRRPKSNVVAFPGLTAPGLPVQNQPITEVVEYLEALLSRAKNGEIREMAIAYTAPHGKPYWNILGHSHDSSALLFGAINLMAIDYAQGVLDQEGVDVSWEKPS